MHSVLSVKTEAGKSFDYASLDDDTSYYVQQQTEEIRGLMKKTAQGIIEIGQRLIEVKKRLGYGKYRQWIEAEFNWGKSTANSFENVARRFSDVQNLDNFALSALYELAAPSTPERVREEAIARADSGEFISYTTAKEIRQKSTSAGLESRSQLAKSSHSEAEIAPKSLSIALESQQIAKEPTRLESSKIIAIHPQEHQQPSVVPEKTETPISYPTTLTKSQLVQPGSWWQFEERHLLYCGDPHSSQFQARLPQQIALVIAFPATADWQLGTLALRAKSALTLSSTYQDLDLKLLRDLIQNALDLYTDEGETVLFSYLLDPALLLLAHQLDCHCAIAEPNPDRCEAMIQAWTQMGRKVELKK
jgi:hypothetical protein